MLMKKLVIRETQLILELYDNGTNRVTTNYGMTNRSYLIHNR